MGLSGRTLSANELISMGNKLPILQICAVTRMYVMWVNPQKETQLATLRLTAGIEQFKSSLGRIHLPADRRQWPHFSFIKKANRFRGIVP